MDYALDIKIYTMLKKIRLPLFFSLILFPVLVKSQSIYSIPSYTAYALPAEGISEDRESNIREKNNGRRIFFNIV